MVAKNHTIYLKVEKETKELLKEIANKTRLKETDISRLLLNKVMREIKAKAVLEGWDNVFFGIKK